MVLKTRRPTGAVPWPLILLEGPEKVGKSYACAQLSASGRVGDTYWIDIAEGAADEYGAVPGADYLIVEHDGSFGSIYGAVTEIHALAQAALDAGDKPVVLVIDSMTAEWELLKDWATQRAKGSKANRAKLARDPMAEITVSQVYWNDANARHRRLMKLLMTFPGICVMTARGKYVTAVGENGQPIEGQKEYRVEGQKNLAYDASCWVRLSREEPAIVVGARSVHAGIRPGRDEPKRLPADWSLEWLIFEALQCDPSRAHARELVEAHPERSPEQIRDEAINPATSFTRLRELFAEAKRTGYEGVIVSDERGQEVLLVDLITRLGRERKPQETASEKKQISADQAGQPDGSETAA